MHLSDEEAESRVDYISIIWYSQRDCDKNSKPPREGSILAIQDMTAFIKKRQNMNYSLRILDHLSNRKVLLQFWTARKLYSMLKSSETGSYTDVKM